jgi:hypothetical protein
MPFIFNVSLYIQVKGDYNQTALFGFRPAKVVPRWSDLVLPGPECHSPSWDGSASLLAFPQFEKKKATLFRVALWLGGTYAPIYFSRNASFSAIHFGR